MKTKQTGITMTACASVLAPGPHMGTHIVVEVSVSGMFVHVLDTSVWSLDTYGDNGIFRYYPTM